MCTTKSEVNTAILNSENIDDDSVLEIIGVIQGKGASTSCRNSGNDSDLIITGFIPSAISSAYNTSKKANVCIPIKTENDEAELSKEEINFTLSPGDTETGMLYLLVSDTNQN